ncbi:MAG: hypothetical protein MJA27_02870 [Pseudanabaenales cyanobacterium]|nr:hypothetical protein [Pseudanabaenales cyanobacterium]
MSGDPTFEEQIERLRQCILRTWWRVVSVLWLTIGLLSIWGLRFEIQTWLDYFTWTAVRYGLAYNPIYSFGLALCLGLTISLLISESRHILFGLAKAERRRLERQLLHILQQGPSHPFWKWVVRD